MITSFGRLRIVKHVDSSETQSYVVFDPERNGEVLLHLLPAEGTLEERAFGERLNRLLDSSKKIVLKRGDIFGAEYVVTELAPNFETLIRLLEQYSNGAEKQEGQMGEFTRVFYKDQPPKAPAERANPEPSSGAGDFTRYFKIPKQPAAVNSVEAQPLPNPAADPDRTNLFEHPDEPVKPLPSSQPEPRAKPVSKEFNRYFQEPLGKPSAGVDFSKKAAAAPNAKPKPGNFTQMFGRPFSQSTRQEPAAQRQESSGATGVFSASDRDLPLASSGTGREGEYTRIIKSPSFPLTAPGNSASQAPSPAGSPAAGPSPTLIYVLLAILLVIAISLVLYFGLKS